MNTAKKFAVFFVVALLSSTSWGMKESKEGNPVLPDAVALHIRGYLGVGDLARSSIVCREWNRLGNSNQLWAVLARHLEADIFKEDECSWKQTVNWATIILRVFHLAAWEKKELEFAISDEGFALLEKLLLKKIKQSVIKRMELRIVDSKDLLAAFLAYYMLDMSAVWNDAWKAAEDAAWNAAGDATRDAVVRNATGDAAVRNAAWDAAWNVAYEAARNAAYEAAWGDAYYHAARDAVSKALHTLELKDPAVIGKAASILSILCVLAYASQNEYFDNNFNKAFSAAKSELGRSGFSMPANKILSIIAAATWDDPVLSGDPHIEVLRDILVRLASKVQAQQEGKNGE